LSDTTHRAAAGTLASCANIGAPRNFRQ
jgi:hypothetical protein